MLSLALLLALASTDPSTCEEQKDLLAMAIGTDGMPIIAYCDGTNDELRVVHCANRFCLPYLRED